MKNTVKFEFLSLSENEALARSVAAAFIMPLDPTLEELADVRTAVSEAVTNAIVHGYKKRKARFAWNAGWTEDCWLFQLRISAAVLRILSRHGSRFSRPMRTGKDREWVSQLWKRLWMMLTLCQDAISELVSRLKNSSRNRIIRQFATALRTAKATCTMKKAKMIRNAFPAGIQSNRHTE